MRSAALDLAKRFSIIPLWPVLPSLRGDGFICGCGKLSCKSPGKHPLGPLAPNGVTDAAQDLRTVENWWRSRPDANIGIATGAGLAVLDIDPRHGGDQTIVELQKKHGRLPKTLTARTGGGGWHVYLSGEVPNSVGALGEGVDTRGPGGFVVAPPSLHASGNRYEWRGDRGAQIVPALDWITAVMTTLQGKARTLDEWRGLVCRDVVEGNRNDMLASYAGMLLRRYVDPTVTLDLLHCWNACRCKPPLDDDEVETIVDSICKKELRRRKA